jgi:hypothetical protein
MAEPEWRRLNRLHWDDRVAIHLGPRGYDLDRLLLQRGAAEIVGLIFRRRRS